MTDKRNSQKMKTLDYEIDRVRDLLNRLLTINGGNTTSQNVVKLSQKLDNMIVEYAKSCNNMEPFHIDEERECICDKNS